MCFAREPIEVAYGETEVDLLYVLLSGFTWQLMDKSQRIFDFAGVDDPDVLTPHSRFVLGFDGLAQAQQGRSCDDIHIFGPRAALRMFLLLAVGIEIAGTERGFVEPVFDIVNKLLREFSIHEVHEGIELMVFWLLGVAPAR